MRKRIIDSVLGVLLTFGMLPWAPAVVLAEGDVPEPAKESDISEDDLIPETDEVVIEEQEVSATSDMLHFVLDVRWGNVRGDIETREETNFDGSIAVPSTGRVSIRQLLRWENHDSLTSRKNPVSWTSKIYGHWDGVRVLVSAQAGDIVTVATTQGNMVMTAKELFELSTPHVTDTGSGREIVLRTRPFERRAYFLAVGWGNAGGDMSDEATTAAGTNAVMTVGDHVNFSGSATVGGNSKMKAVRPLRFERRQGDAIKQHDRTSVVWRSWIGGGLDGVLLRLHPDRTNAAADKLTLALSELGFSQSFSLLDLYHNEVTTVDVPVAGSEQSYQLTLRVWKHPYRKLVRARNSAKVYLIEGDLRRHVVSVDAFNRAGLKWEEVEVIDDEDVDVYADGEPAGYDDGMLIKGSGPKVWVIADGKRRHVADPAAFARLGYDWKNLIQIPDADVAQYEEDDALDGEDQAPEGALLRVEGDPKVYRIEGGRRKHVPNPDVFEAQRLRWTHVQIVKDDVVSELPTGEELNYPNGAVVAAVDGRVFEIINGERRHLKSAKELLLRGHTWQSVRKDETGALIGKFEDGDDVELLDDVPLL